MLLKSLKEEVLQANLELPKYGLVTFTWGNASGIDRAKGLMVIKPSGVPYEELTVEDLVVLDLDGNQVEGKLRPSSDTPTHLVLYNAFKEIGGIVHTHSPWATAWAQAGLPIRPMGTTHADYFYGEIPCTRRLSQSETEGDYEKNTGHVIADTFKDLNPVFVPGVLVEDHAPFSWGKNALEAVHNAAVMEEVAKLAFHTQILSGRTDNDINRYLLDRHFLRKHGANAYYGQKA